MVNKKQPNLSLDELYKIREAYRHFQSMNPLVRVINELIDIREEEKKEIQSAVKNYISTQKKRGDNQMTLERLKQLLQAIESEAYDEEVIHKALSSDELKALVKLAISALVNEQLDMSDADCFSIERLHEIIYGSKLRGLEAKLLARFMNDAKQVKGSEA